MTSKYFVARVALALVIAAVSVAAYASHSWSNYHWARTGNPFTLQTLNSTVFVSANANWPAWLSAAASDSQWSKSE